MTLQPTRWADSPDDMNKDFQAGESQAFGAVDNREARGIPTAPVQPGAFTPERFPHVLPQTNRPDDHQLNTPCSIRPKTASISRVPASVSSLDKGTRLPSAPVGFTQPARDFLPITEYL